MLQRSTLDNWINGNFSDLTKSELIKLCRYFENGKDEEIEEDYND